jgi:hypothetical protein
VLGDGLDRHGLRRHAGALHAQLAWGDHADAVIGVLAGDLAGDPAVPGGELLAAAGERQPRKQHDLQSGQREGGPPATQAASL